MVTEIKDFADPALDLYARLSENRLYRYREPEPGYFIAESAKVILRALDAGYKAVSVLAEDRQLCREAAEICARCPDVPVYTAQEEVLRKLTGFPMTRGVLSIMQRTPLPDVQEVCGNARRIAVLEHVTNPTNVGAVFRSAAAMGMDAVLLLKGCADPLQRRAIRVSMGTVFQIPWTFAESAGRIREMGFMMAALALREDAWSIRDERLKSSGRLALLLGNEGDGLLPETIACCDAVVRIPMAGGVDSLNVAAASAVAFWELQ